ncbi:MAG: hypothetical protein NT166_15520 [Candidatus Aminicenantes bacterium]|nr:hypothetical protein [Candidatus Aminicenantes bacterium]
MRASKYLIFVLFFMLLIDTPAVCGDYEEAWDIAIKDHAKGKTAAQAIKDVYHHMQSPDISTSVAIIIGAVYADTYWVKTKMDPDILSSDMQMSTGLSKNVCDQAAREAFSKWCGILVRKEFNDTGIIPSPGDYFSSPDIVCSGPAELSRVILLKQWNTLFWNNPQVGKNFCYTRCVNLGFQGPIEKAKVRMFSSRVGFNIPPTSWQILYTKDNQIYLPVIGMQPGALNIGDRAASDAFLFEPSSSGYFGIIASVSTEFFTNDPLTFPGGNWNSIEWITHNSAAGWHNTSVQTTIKSILKFYNQDSSPERFAFEAHCHKVPVGTVILLKCSDAKIPDLDSGAVKIDKKHQSVIAEGKVPANYKGDLLMRIEGPRGKLLPTGAAVTVQMVWILEYGHKHYTQAVDMLKAHDAAKASQEIRVPMGSFIFTGPPTPGVLSLEEKGTGEFLSKMSLFPFFLKRVPIGMHYAVETW